MKTVLKCWLSVSSYGLKFCKLFTGYQPSATVIVAFSLVNCVNNPYLPVPFPFHMERKYFCASNSFSAKNTSACTLFYEAFCFVVLHAFTIYEVLLNCSWGIPYIIWVQVYLPEAGNLTNWAGFWCPYAGRLTNKKHPTTTKPQLLLKFLDLLKGDQQDKCFGLRAVVTQLCFLWVLHVLDILFWFLQKMSELRSCVKVKVAVLGFLS